MVEGDGVHLSAEQQLQLVDLRRALHRFPEQAFFAQIAVQAATFYAH